MFGIGLYDAYSQYTFDFLGGANGALLMAIFTRLVVGIGWFFLFKKAGKRPWFAFIPLLGPYTAFRMVWDDFSMSAIFGATTFIAFVEAVSPETNGVITACAVINFLLWWLMALLTSNRFGVSLIFGFVYGGIPWFGSILLGVWPSANYKGPWSSDPEAEQNLSAAERKKRRKKAKKKAKK